MRYIIYIVFLIPCFLFGQNIDSLKLALKNAKHDTTRCNILNAMIESEADENIWPKYNKQLQTLAEKNIANKATPKNVYLKHLAAALNNIGFIYYNQGDIMKTLHYQHKCLKIMEEIGNTEGISTALNNLGVIYSAQGDIPKALEYHKKSLSLMKKIGKKEGIANSLSNIGAIYTDQGDLPKALEYYQKSLQLREEIGDKNGTGYSLHHIGIIYEFKGDISKALKYFNESLKIREEIGDKVGTATSLNNIARLAFKKGQITEAFVLARKGMQVAKELGYPEKIKNSANTLKSIFQKQNKYKEAFEMYELEIKMRDSINNEETQKVAVKKQMQYQYETQARELKNEQDKKDIIAKAELMQKEKERNYFIIGFALVIVLAGFIFRSYRQKQKANILIAYQKKEVEESKKEIIDSIHYAKRIQKAHLPTEKQIEKNLNRLQNKG